MRTLLLLIGLVGAALPLAAQRGPLRMALPTTYAEEPWAPRPADTVRVGFDPLADRDSLIVRHPFGALGDANTRIAFAYLEADTVTLVVLQVPRPAWRPVSVSLDSTRERKFTAVIGLPSGAAAWLRVVFRDPVTGTDELLIAQALPRLRPRP